MVRANTSILPEVAAITDGDARENWQFVLAFRDLLLRQPTLEAAYLALVRSGSIDLPGPAVRAGVAIRAIPTIRAATVAVPIFFM